MLRFRNMRHQISPRTQAACYLQFILRRMLLVKFLFLVSSTSFAYLFLVQLATRQDQPTDTEVLGNFGYDDKTMFPEGFKYILLWTPYSDTSFYFLGEGQRAFLTNNCSVKNCYATTNRKLFGANLARFDAIAFNGHNMKHEDLPSDRSPHQHYIYFNMESADNYPLCEALFDNFFNWSFTYRLDSNVPNPYILIRDGKGEVVGPKQKMRWKANMTTIMHDEFVDRIQNKTRAAAWFVSNCKTRSGREAYVKALQDALKPYGFTVDVYGKCGTLKCQGHVQFICNDLLKYYYFFYMVMENSFDEDYVTEKLLRALKNDVVPIVYGGADYTRFLPPGSYIDSRKHTVNELAAIMNRLMHSPKEYSQYFRWKNYYSYEQSSNENACVVCEALHNKKMLKNTKISVNFRNWWNPKNRCPVNY